MSFSHAELLSQLIKDNYKKESLQWNQFKIVKRPSKFCIFGATVSKITLFTKISNYFIKLADKYKAYKRRTQASRSMALIA